MIEVGRVIVTRSDPTRSTAPFATFVEWYGEADRKGYADF